MVLNIFLWGDNNKLIVINIIRKLVMKWQYKAKIMKILSNIPMGGII